MVCVDGIGIRHCPVYLYAVIGWSPTRTRGASAARDEAASGVGELVVAAADWGAVSAIRRRSLLA